MRKTAASMIAAILAVGPAVPASAQMRAVTANAPVVPVSPVMAVPSSMFSPTPSFSAPGLNAPVLPSALPTLSNPAASVRPAAASAAVLPAAAASAVAAPMALPASALRAAAAPAVGAANLAGNEQDARGNSTAQDLGEIGREVASAVESVGPVADASPAQAQGLGSKLIELLTRPFRRSDQKNKPVTPAGVAKLRRKLALNAATDEGPAAAPQASPEATKEAMVQTLDYVASIFNAHYAPLDWKKATFGMQLSQERDKARAAIRAMPNPTRREFQDILSRFVTSMRDYHVGIQFYSTEMSMLPLSIVGADGRYFLAWVDREALPEEQFPFKVGDEVLAFDGKPVSEVVDGLLKVKSEGGSETTDRSMAARRLTRRIRQGGDAAVEGPVSIVLKGAIGTAEVQMEWQHVPELIPEAPIRDGGGLFEPPAPTPSAPVTVENAGGGSIDQGWAASLKAAIQSLIPSGLNPTAALYGRRAPKERMNPYQIGGRESFVPELGEVVWKANARSPFHAYIFKTAEGKKVGYVRIASYEGDKKAAEKFGELMEKFEAETDSLVIDQVNNPGGSLFYMYALLSRLTAKPLAAPTQKVAVGEEDAYEAIQTLMAAQQVRTEEQVRQVLGESLDGYAVTMKLWRAFVMYAQFVYTQIKAGKRLTDLFPFLGLDKIEAHPAQRYTKPIMMLINEMDFSCGDFFPAILQDNKRATLFGVRTSGAGGAVKGLSFPNQFGIAGLSYTWTIAMRTNGKPIENLGVTPDVQYTPTAEDLANGYQAYKAAVLETLKKLMGVQE